MIETDSTRMTSVESVFHASLSDNKHTFGVKVSRELSEGRDSGLIKGPNLSSIWG